MAEQPTIVRFTREEHETLAAVSAGSAMGDALRSYWVPVCLSEELDGADSPPIQVQIMGEPLVVFRDSSGKIGLLGEFCPHRGSSLFFGRNADGGIQCLYHGWKFDVDGKNVENPTCPQLVNSSETAQLAYPTHEAGGLIFAYMGSQSPPPPVPDLGFLQVEDSHRYVSKRPQPCHWLQALEADIDSAHVPYLHREGLLAEADDPFARNILKETDPEFLMQPEEYGLLIAARRDFGDDASYWRVNHWLAPWYTVVPAESVNEVRKIHAWVPVDEHSTWVFGLSWHPDRELTPEELELYQSGRGGIYAEKDPITYVANRNLANNYLIDREAQRTGTLWTGISGNQEQDDMATATMGPAFDRSRETLVGTDGGVIATRRALLQVVANHDAGSEIVGQAGTGFNVPGVSVVLPHGADWLAEIRKVMQGEESTAVITAGGLES